MTETAVVRAMFDLDGCLIDSTPAITGALLHALVEAGVTGHRQEDLVWCVGPPLFDSVTRLLVAADADVGLADSIVAAYRERYRETSLELTRVIPGIPDVLRGLAERDLQLAVVTSKPRPFALPLLEGLGLREHFVAVHGPDADELLEGKEVTLRRALDELAPTAPPATAAMIGDRSHDIVAGRACGTRTVGVTWGAGSRDELEQAGADHVVDTPDELTTLLAP
jgi:phosphoglycolate phosphatase